jgi:hypothetical protein
MNVQQMQEYKRLCDTVKQLQIDIAELQKEIEALKEARPILSRKKNADKV